MASRDGVAINVDGGFAEAYYNRGHSLVHTPYQLYGIILPTPDEIREAERKLESAPLDIELIDEFRQPMKIKDTIEGRACRSSATRSCSRSGNWRNRTGSMLHLRTLRRQLTVWIPTTEWKLSGRRRSPP